MARRKYRSILFSHAARQLEARAVPAAGSWEIWIYENNRALTRYTFIDMQTVKDAEHYHLDLLGDEMSATIKAVKARHLISDERVVAAAIWRNRKLRPGLLPKIDAETVFLPEESI